MCARCITSALNLHQRINQGAKRECSVLTLSQDNQQRKGNQYVYNRNYH